MVRGLALVLTVLTGFSGLVYEVAWQKYFATLLGSHSEATAAVLGIFLGGLSVGYAVFGGVSRRAAADRPTGRGLPLLWIYGLVECGIGVYGIAFPWLFHLALTFSHAVPHEAGGLGFAFDVLLTIVLIGLPTVLMGGTIPVLTQALARSLQDATRFHALVYASNTMGAFTGALAAGFVLVDWLGLDGVVRGAACMNLFAGALFLALGRHAAPVAATEPITSAAPRVAGFVWVAAAAALSGFAMMAIQTVLNRLGALSFGASQLTFSMVVAVFVLCIALGSFAVSALPRVPRGSVVVAQGALLLLVIALYRELENAPYWAHALRALFRDEPAAFYPYQLAVFTLLLLALAAPIGLSGALLPLLFHELRREAGDLGAVAGRLYSWNTVGSLFGALLGGYLFLFVLDLQHVYRIAAACLALAAALLAVRLLHARAAIVAVIVFALAGLWIARLDAWRPERLSAGAFRYRTPTAETFHGPDAFFRSFRTDEPILLADDDPVTTVTVRETQTGGFGRSLFTNGKPDTRIPYELRTPLLAAVLPCLFAEDCRSAFVIGLGTGATSGELASLEGMEHVVTAEISPAVTAALPLFGFGNQQAHRNPRISIRPIDAYRALLQDQQRYDVIVSEPSNPWVVGVENLYAREFFLAAKARLEPGGLYAQWFHAYESSRETMDLVLRTFTSVFEASSMWSAMPGDLVLLGWNDPSRALDVARLEERIRRPSYAAALARVNIRDLAGLVANEQIPLGVASKTVPPGPLHVLLHPILGHRAAIDFFAGATAEAAPAPGLAAAQLGASTSLVRRLRAARGDAYDEAARTSAIAETCVYRSAECATLLAEWTAEDPGATALQQLEQRLEAQGIVRRERVALLARLFGAGCAEFSDSGLRIAEVRRITKAFEAHYHHAAPFRRHALASCWDVCRDEANGAECLSERAAVETRLGDLAAEVDRNTMAPYSPAPSAAGR